MRPTNPLHRPLPLPFHPYHLYPFSSIPPTLTVGIRLPSASYYLLWEISPNVITSFPFHVSWLLFNLSWRLDWEIRVLCLLIRPVMFSFLFCWEIFVFISVSWGVSSGFIHITLLVSFFEINAHHNIWTFVVFFFTGSSSMAYMLDESINNHPSIHQVICTEYRE